MAGPSRRSASLGKTVAIALAVPVIATLIHALIVAPPLRGSDDAVFVAVYCAEVVIWLALTTWVLTRLENSAGQAVVAAVLGWLVATAAASLVAMVIVLAVCGDDRCFS